MVFKKKMSPDFAKRPLGGGGCYIAPSGEPLFQLQRNSLRRMHKTAGQGSALFDAIKG